MSDLWKGVLLGFFFGVVASCVAGYLLKLWARYQKYKAAAKFAGTWVAYNIHGRMVDTTPMPGAGLTVISRKHHWWSADSAVLDVRAQDIDASTGRTRDQEGHIVLDPMFPGHATRNVHYADSDEMSEQRLQISSDLKTVYVFPVPTFATLGDVYGKHAWRRK